MYMRVSTDEYELPEVIADSWKELALKCGVSTDTIKTHRFKYRNGIVKHEKYIKVELDEKSV